MAYKNYKDFSDDWSSKTGSLLNAMEELPNTRLADGLTNRDKQIMTWMLPNGSSVQMYINPESFSINETKQLNPVRTKGGYVVQYWGSQLTTMTIQGTTGSSGIKGITLLRDIYNSENRIFELVAGSQTNKLINAVQSGSITDASLGQSLIPQVAKDIRNNSFILRPSLASLALSVTLFYQGMEYRGFFTNMTITEDIQKLGLFSYNIGFTITEQRGSRKNFMAWHREAIADDPTGQALNALTSMAGNAARKLIGLAPTQVTPMTFHPGSAPLSFGGNTLATLAGVPETPKADVSQNETASSNMIPPPPIPTSLSGKVKAANDEAKKNKELMVKTLSPGVERDIKKEFPTYLDHIKPTAIAKAIRDSYDVVQQGPVPKTQQELNRQVSSNAAKIVKNQIRNSIRGQQLGPQGGGRI